MSFQTSSPFPAEYNSQQQPQEQQDQQDDEDDLGILDLLIIQDTTGSQTPYISSTTKSCVEICHILRNSGKLLPEDGMRLGLIAFRDHPPQDYSYVTRDFGGFTVDFEKVERNLKSLVANGGGDRPEAVTSALARALNLDWRPAATKVILLITDAPPHGIGEIRDGFPAGDPEGHDPLVLAREMADRGIVLLTLACEPTLSRHTFANEFYKALSDITTGVMFPLTRTDLLAPFIIGSTLRNIVLDLLAREFQELVKNGANSGKSVDEISREVFENLQNRSQKITDIEAETVYRESTQVDRNVEVWKKAENLATARAKLAPVRESRFIPEYDPSFPGTKPNSSKYSIQVTFKNTGEDIIQYEYFEDGKLQSGEIESGHLNPRPFQLNTPYNFVLKCGRKRTTFGRAFSRYQDLDLRQYFI